MSRHFIIDGYNVLHSDRRWTDMPWEKRRLQFLRLVEESRPTESQHNTMTVVFDGYAASLSGVRLSGVRLIFSGDRDADTVIKEHVAHLSNPKDAVVVTNDRAIQAVVRQSGAQVLSSENFFLLQKKKPAPPLREKLDSGSVESINDELKRKWNLD